ncbi:MAG TPA: hypothetical protein VN836_01600 [Verrucomicrobiae bacterium]|nr:hypothetical protein [Verrucomicrobiae bacterium]
MTIQDYLKGEFTGKPKKDDRGRESDWLEFCDLTVRGSKVQVVDASYVPDEREGCMVTLAPGSYHVEVKATAYGGDVRISRLRLVRHGVSPSIGAVLGETGTDTANIGVCDHEVFARAWGGDNDASWEIISPAIEEADTHGIAVLDETAGAVMPFVRSGFGDGTFPVHELVADGSRAGFEVVFIRGDEPYPF